MLDKKVKDCPHRQFKIQAVEANKLEIPCLNDLCYAIGELFAGMEWARVTEKQIQKMTLVMNELDCACYNRIVYEGK